MKTEGDIVGSGGILQQHSYQRADTVTVKGKEGSMRRPYYFSPSPNILSIGTRVQVEALPAGGNNLCQLLQSIYSLGTVVSTCADRE